MIALILLISFMICLAMGIPVAFSMATSSLLVILLSPGLEPQTIPQMMAVGVQSFPLMAVPFFILAGNIMNSLGVTQRIFDFALVLVRHIKGGLGHVNVLASMIFAGISGSAAADAAGLGTIEMKAMTKEGYSKRFSAAITAASSVLGPIIPPSIILIIYAVEANVSIIKMFVAGILPGILIGLSLMLMVYYLAATGKEFAPSRPRATSKEVWTTIKGSILAVIAPLIILAGMIWGFVTPTETGVLAVIYSIFVGLIHGDINFRDLPQVIKESVLSTAQVMFLFAAATVFGWVITMSRVPHIVSEFLLSLELNTLAMLLILNLFFIILGCFLEAIAALVITLPVVMPIVTHLGIDPIHFGIIICFNLMIGLITPPMGMGLYIVSMVGDVKFEEVLKGSIPFLLILLVALLVITFIPQITLWLPSFLET